MSTDIERRTHDNLRALVDQACGGVMPHIEKRIRDVARKAYYLGCADGMRFAKESDEEREEKRG